MVLADLGAKIQGAFQKLNATTVVDEEVLNAVLGEISRALLEADVNVRLVGSLRNNVKKAINLEDTAAGVNKRRLIQKTVVDQLGKILTADKEAYKPQKGKTNVVMFVGLQVGSRGACNSKP